jgi:hypothetical protein
VYSCTLWGGGKLKKLERNRDEVEEEEGGGWTTEEEGRRKLAFWNTSAETQAESLSQSGKVLLPILYFSNPYTDKKENQIFLIYREIQSGAVAQSYITNGLLIYREIFPHILGSPSSYMTLQLLHSEFPYI